MPSRSGLSYFDLPAKIVLSSLWENMPQLWHAFSFTPASFVLLLSALCFNDCWETKKIHVNLPYMHTGFSSITQVLLSRLGGSATRSRRPELPGNHSWAHLAQRSRHLHGLCGKGPRSIVRWHGSAGTSWKGHPTGKCREGGTPNAAEMVAGFPKLF